MKTESFEYIAKLVKERSGIVLTREKEYLLESRLEPVARNHGMQSVDDVADALRKGAQSVLAGDVIEAMTTNETFFFRDRTPFDLFKNEMLPHMKQARGAEKKLRIWCAAASMGQEPYSLGMLLKEDPVMAGWKIDILGTDISNEALEKAKSGLYSQFEVQRGLPVQLLVKYFKQHGDLWQLDSAVRAMVQYRNFNLLNSFSVHGRFDIVFCRNVLIYFDQPTKRDILERIAKQMPDDGFLVLGAAETVIGITNMFKSVPGKRGLFTLNREENGKMPLRSAMASAGGARAAAAPRPQAGSFASRFPLKTG